MIESLVDVRDDDDDQNDSNKLHIYVGLANTHVYKRTKYTCKTSNISLMYIICLCYLFVYIRSGYWPETDQTQKQRMKKNFLPYHSHQDYLYTYDQIRAWREDN